MNPTAGGRHQHSSRTGHSPVAGERGRQLALRVLMTTSARAVLTVSIFLIFAACLQHGVTRPQNRPAGTGQIRFQVLDQNSNPFPGIPVRLSPRGKNGADRSLVTDAQGEGTFAGLYEGQEYSLYVEPPVGLQIEAVEKAGDSSTPPRQYRLLDLRAGVLLGARDPTPEEENICEAVFRAFIDTDEFGFERRGHHYYLTLLGKDPSQQFLNRFRKHRARFFRGSLFEVSPGSTHFSIYYVAWESDSRVEVGGGYYSGMLAADGRTLILTRGNGLWSVVSNVKNWSS